jgi:hypothetical protein
MRHVLPREVVIDRMLKAVNGTSFADPANAYALTRDRAAHVLDLFKGAFANSLHESGQLAKDVNVSTGLTYYDLRAPALNLFPTVTPLRNAIARRQRPNPGDAAHWKSVLATTGSGISSMGWVPERRRAASMSYTVQNNSIPYATLGEEDSLSDEAKYAALGFEDEDALVQLRLMLKFFQKEEAAILGGNNSLSLSTPNAPSTGQPTVAGSTLPAATYSVIVVALTQEGYRAASLSGGVVQQTQITGNDGQQYTLNGGSSNKSSNATQGITSGQALTASTPTVNGAVAYAWYVGAAGSETLQAITTINSVQFSAPLATGQQAATAITANRSNNNGVAFDGLLTTAFNNAGTNAYVNLLGTGTAGTGTALTSSGAGGVNEIDAMFKSMWDQYRISPTVLYVNSQELKNITAKVLNGGGAAPLLRYQVEADQQGVAEYKLTAAGTIAYYFNPYTADGGARIPVKIHPDLAPGTIIGWAESLPPWYVSNETPAVAEILTRRDVYTEDWTRTTRADYYGVYSQEALAVYAPFSMGVLGNIANG